MNGEAEAVRQLLDRWILYRQESYFQRAFGLIPQRQSLLPDLSVQLHQGWGLLPSGDVSRLTYPELVLAVAPLARTVFERGWSWV